MTREKLENYREAVGEIASLREEIRQLQDEMRVHDTVQGSCPEYPYLLHTIGVYGLGDDPLKNQQIIAKRKREARLVKDCAEVMEWYQGITDSLVSRAVWLYYLDGKRRTWAQVSTELTGSPWQENSLKMAVGRLLKKDGAS